MHFSVAHFVGDCFGLIPALGSFASSAFAVPSEATLGGQLDEELRGFLEMAAEEKIKQGMSHQDARRSLRLKQGSVEISKEVVRSAGWKSLLDACWRDLRVGLR